ncbi:hypothetical protein [Haloferula sp.]|uniref:hypothetical protein n=1 Tax=Haloferula sp. TaxID=2497595 RepID=UPI003C78E71F
MRIKPALFLTAAITLTGAHATERGIVDCTQIAARTLATAERASVDPVELLNLIDREVSASPGCACEIVKAAIIGTGCDDAIVGYIVETAVRASPENMRMIAQCAIATAPDSIVRVQEVMGRLDPGAGEGRSAKSAKSAKDAKGLEVKPAATPPDPLDIPIITIPPIPPIVNPPPSTRTNFQDNSVPAP